MDNEFASLNVPATQSAFSRLIGVSQPAVHAYLKKNILTSGGTLASWLLEYTEHIRAEAAGRPENDDDIKTVTIREKKANARHKEIQTLQLEATLVDKDEVYYEMLPWFSHMKTQLEASGNRIATMLTAQYGVTIDKRLIDKEHRNALGEIAKYVDNSESTASTAS